MNPEDKLIVDYILEIDWMGTKEFCEYSGYPTPYFQAGKTPEQLAQQFIGVDAKRWAKTVEYAKLIRRAKPKEEGGVKEWIIRIKDQFIAGTGNGGYSMTYNRSECKSYSIEDAIQTQTMLKKHYPTEMFTIIPK